MAAKAPARIFTQLSPLIHHSPAASASPAASPQQPDMVVLFGWMDGSLRHLTKYASGYTSLYPSSQLLLVQATSRQFAKSTAKQMQDVQPAVDVLKRAGLMGKAGRGRILVQAFSNGGSLQMTAFAKAVRQEQEKQAGKEKNDSVEAALVPAAMVFDSCPGSDSFRIALKAFTLPYRTLFMKAAVTLTLSFVWAITSLPRWLSTYILSRPYPTTIQRIRNDLLDPSLFARDSRRTYIYSKEDKLIPWESVEAHAKDVELVAGKDKVRMERFEGTQHVAHVIGGSERYWEVVKTTWDSASKMM